MIRSQGAWASQHVEVCTSKLWADRNWGVFVGSSCNGGRMLQWWEASNKNEAALIPGCLTLKGVAGVTSCWWDNGHSGLLWRWVSLIVHSLNMYVPVCRYICRILIQPYSPKPDVLWCGYWIIYLNHTELAFVTVPTGFLLVFSPILLCKCPETPRQDREKFCDTVLHCVTPFSEKPNADWNCFFLLRFMNAASDLGWFLSVWSPDSTI